MVIHHHNHLPEELLIYEIFGRLPPESLLACICVCKRWNSIISNPKFASFHLQKSPFSDHQSVLINTKTCFLSFNSEDHKSHTVAKISEIDASIVASCNGLICLDDEAHNSLYIWNPTTLKKTQIPYPQPLIKTAVVWGFGHVSSTDDYKIVRITDHRSMKQVQVFSFTSKAWKNLDIEIENCSLGKIPPLTETGVSINNWIYWAVYYTEYDIGFYDQCFHIMGLNLIDEKFTPIEPLPEWPDHGFYGPPALFQKDGSLCVCWKNNEGGIDIGMYKEDTGRSSWIKLYHFEEGAFRFGRRIWSQKIQGITAGNYIVYLDGDSISLLDPNQDPPKEVTSFKIPKSENSITYRKSLLSPIALLV